MDWISVQALQQPMALLSEDTKERIIDVREFRHGDLFKGPTGYVASFLQMGSLCPERPRLTNQKSTITGEAIPIPKTSGSRVVAGSVNGLDTVGLGVGRSRYSAIPCIRIHQPALSYAG